MVDVSRSPGPLRIVVGAGEHERPGWIMTQREHLDLLRRDDWVSSFGERRIAAVLAEHVWEHLTSDEAVQAARICFEFLEPGGYVRCAVPDGLFPDPEYLRTVRVGGPGPSNHPAAGHKVLYDYRTLSGVFTQTGFSVQLLEYWDDSGRFHFTEWDAADGFIYRSRRFDHRNQNGQLGFTSLILDAAKPGASDR